MAYGMHFGRRDLDRMGVFAEMGYLHGAKYTPPIRGIQCRDPKGRQMFPGYPKWKSGLQDCYFDQQFKRIFIKEGLNNLAKKENKDRLESKKKNISGFPFVPVGETKKHATPGDQFGTFSGVIPEFSPRLKKELLKKGKKVPTPGNMMTNPGKKGGPGYVDICFSPYPAYKGHKYDEPRMKKTPLPAPFVAGSENAYFDDNPYLTTKLQPIYRKENELKFTLYGAFYPSSPGKRMGGCMAGGFSNWPNHLPEKWVPQHKVMKELEKMFKDRMAKYAKKSGRAFKTIVNPNMIPPSEVKSMPTRSIIEAKLDATCIRAGTEITPVTYTKEWLGDEKL